MRSQQTNGPTNPHNSASPPPEAGLSLVVRLGWMVAGPLAILSATFVIASKPQWTFGVADVVLAGGASVALVLRYWDISALHGQTANGEPASMALYPRYALCTLFLAGLAWVAAQSVWL